MLWLQLDLASGVDVTDCVGVAGLPTQIGAMGCAYPQVARVPHVRAGAHYPQAVELSVTS